jgi:hypothetical protein
MLIISILVSLELLERYFALFINSSTKTMKDFKDKIINFSSSLLLHLYLSGEIRIKKTNWDMHFPNKINDSENSN